MCLLGAVLGVPGRAQNFDKGYCTWYAAQNFAGINWQGNAKDWLANAKDWVTVTDPRAAETGSIAVWSGGTYGHVAVVRSVSNDGIHIDEMNFGPKWIDEASGKTDKWNQVTGADLKFNAMDRSKGKLRFVGYVLPRKRITELYTVVITVCPNTDKGRAAYVTFYGRDNYYRRVQVGGGDNSVTLDRVPGGKGVRVRVDVDLKSGAHKEYYEQEIYGSNRAVRLNFTP